MMNKTVSLLLSVFLVFCFLQAVAVADDTNQTPNPTMRPNQIYLPGDVVHIVVEAPIDTSSVTATMPDDQELQMIYDQRTKVWHNYWQVPMSFKKGTYTATLVAMDVEGRTFTGKSAPIFIDEPTMPLVMRFAPAPAAAPVAAAPTRATSAPAPVAAVPSRRATSAPVAVAAETRVATKASTRTAKAPVKSVKTAAAPKEDINVTRMRYMTLARDFMAQQKYEEAKKQLEALLKIDPQNKEIVIMISRLDAIIKAKGAIE
jgi:hypothetical protein